MNKEEIKEKIRKQILIGGGETLVDAIYLILEDQEADHLKLIKDLTMEEYKNGYNQCLKDRKLIGERWQNLYL